MRHGQVVVLRLEAERAGHAAAAGVELDDLGAGDAAQQGRRRGGARRAPSGGSGRGRRCGWPRQRVLRGSVEPAGGDGLERAVPPAAGWPRPRPRPRVAGQQGQVLVAQGQQAGRLHRRRSARRGRPRPEPRRPCPRPSAGPGRAAPWTGWPGRSSPRPRSRTCHPASSSSSIAARPTAGSVKVVNESARKISSPRAAARCLAGGRCRNQRAQVCRWNRGSGRAALMPSQRSRQQPAPAATRPARLASGNAAEPSRFSARMRAEHARAQRDAVLIVVGGERLGLQRGHVDAERALALAGLALQAEVEDPVQPLVAERGARVGRRRAPSRRAFARPRVECSSSRVAM